ncbi:site-specific integrase [Chryseobacterium luquanense]|uniref:Site-specific integrase n=1 Tax=Chryseobacterium luquanense TaxID=2983766 RepID=A0ABT3Y4R6_9FLAO|nr:site-specific integrase [Chryseobacterium luquanense]MCX8533117.1 site-specific integrase [Chryseobacterium luquanense]
MHLESVLQHTFDTRRDTKKIFVAMTHKFTIRTDKNKDGKCLVFLLIRSGKLKTTMNLDIKIDPKYWDNLRCRVKKSENFENFNIILDTIEAKIITIKRDFLIYERVLTPELLVENINNSVPAFDFISFCTFHSESGNYKPNTLKAHKTAINKLKEFRKEIPFSMLTLEFFEKYRKWLLTYKGNKDPTCFTDFKILKKFINLADEKGIRLAFNKDKFIVKESKTTPVFLEPEEVGRLHKYYFNEFISRYHFLPLGYFLFSCYTGLRISDIQNLKRQDVEQDIFRFKHVKTSNDQYMKITDELRSILDYNPKLFIDRLSDQKINKQLKNIADVCKIEKSISMHVARHTFATTFLKNSGSIAKLSKLLGHSTMKHTMVYAHLTDQDALQEMRRISYSKSEEEDEQINTQSPS